jgi:hypothetical protein
MPHATAAEKSPPHASPPVVSRSGD